MRTRRRPRRGAETLGNKRMNDARLCSPGDPQVHGVSWARPAAPLRLPGPGPCSAGPKLLQENQTTVSWPVSPPPHRSLELHKEGGADIKGGGGTEVARGWVFTWSLRPEDSSRRTHAQGSPTAGAGLTGLGLPLTQPGPAPLCPLYGGAGPGASCLTLLSHRGSGSALSRRFRLSRLFPLNTH